MLRRVTSSLLAAILSLLTGSAVAAERAFPYTRESNVLGPGVSEVEPWSTFRVGRQRYYSELAARLGLAHGVAPHLQLALYWNLETRAEDVVADPLTRKLSRVSDTELGGASLELKYGLSDASADLLGSALYLETTLGPKRSELEARLVVDRRVGKWLVAANLGARCTLEPLRNDAESNVATSFLLEPRLGARYALPGGFGAGLELRAPLSVAGEADGSALFGGPALSWADQSLWLTLGVAPQLLAFSGKSPGSRLDLSHYERLEVRLILGFLL